MQLDISINPDVVANKGGQSDFIHDWTHFLLGLEGGWYSGKTWAGARKLISLHGINAFDINGDPTFVPSAVVAPTFSNAMDFDIPELEAALRESGLGFEYKSHGSIANGSFSAPAIVVPEFGTKDRPSVIIIRSADDPSKITGWNVGAGWGDEAARWKTDFSDPKKDPFIQFLGRVRHPKATIRQILFTYTPEGDDTRVYKEMSRTDNPDVASYRAATKENKVAEEFCEIQSRILTSKLQKQYLGGETVSFRGGKVYASFDKKIHVKKGLKLNQNLPLHFSFDFNINPGMHCEVGQYIPHQDMYVTIKEFYGERWSVREVCMAIRELVQGKSFPEYCVYGDASGRSGTATTGESCYDIIKSYFDAIPIQYRLCVPRSNGPVVDRVNAMELCLMDSFGVSHWSCDESCERLIRDLAQIKWADSGCFDKRDSELTHASDAESYRINYMRPIRRVPTISGQHSVVPRVYGN